jgi:hypothetical protein
VTIEAIDGGINLGDPLLTSLRNTIRKAVDGDGGWGGG